jgi:hypothetical protein
VGDVGEGGTTGAVGLMPHCRAGLVRAHTGTATAVFSNELVYDYCACVDPPRAVCAIDVSVPHDCCQTHVPRPHAGADARDRERDRAVTVTVTATKHSAPVSFASRWWWCPAPVLRLPGRQGHLASRLCRRLRVSLSLAIAPLLSIFGAAVQLVCRVALHLPHSTHVACCVVVVCARSFLFCTPAPPPL